jgi:hypothetical protein
LLNFFKIGGEHQKKLLEKLFTNYEPLERPVEDDQTSLNVSVKIFYHFIHLFLITVILSFLKRERERTVNRERDLTIVSDRLSCTV